jgi:hypothetical protein
MLKPLMYRNLLNRATNPFNVATLAPISSAPRAVHRDFMFTLPPKRSANEFLNRQLDIALNVLVGETSLQRSG